MILKNNFEELSSASINDSKDIIISQHIKGGYTLGQRLNVEDNGRRTSVFLKNAFHVDNLSGLYNLRDAINLAIHKIEKK